MKKKQKGKKQFMSEKMHMNPDQDFQQNQNHHEFIEDHKRKPKSNTMDETSGTKPNSGSRGWGSHKLTH